MNLKKGRTFLVVFFLGFTLLPQAVFSEDLSDGFYAGPLSVVPEIIQKKAKLKKMKKVLSAGEKVPETTGKVVKPFSAPIIEGAY